MESPWYIYGTDLDEQQQMEWIGFKTTGEIYETEEMAVDIYESTDVYEDHNAVAKTTVQPDPGRNSHCALTVCLVVLCVLLLAGIIGTGLYCRITLQAQNESWAGERKQTLAELNEFCKDGCQSFNHSFYYISSKQKTWNDSRQDCIDRGADLVIVNSKEEQVFINSLKIVFWIGLTDEEEEGTWKWVDGSVLNSERFWEVEQPRGTLQHNCVNNNNNNWYMQQGNWFATRCDRLFLWLCEKKTDF